MADPAALPSFGVPSPKSSPYLVSHVRHLMGMPVSITVRGPRARGEEALSAVQSAYDDLEWVDATFSRWRPDSELSRLRRGELTLAECCPEMALVLGLCEAASVETDRAFAWRLPDDAGEWSIDPTGLVKGWAVARAAGVLAQLEGHAYCVNAGGDICVGGADGSPGGDRPWRLGIEDPRVEGTIAQVVELWAGGLATSGCAARGAHLIDPETGERVLREGSVSVVAPSIVDADLWATALFVGPASLESRVADRPGWQVIRL